MSSEETPKRKSSLGWILCAAAMVVVFLLGMLAASINERKAEVASIYNNKKIELTQTNAKNGDWGLNYPREYETWKMTEKGDFKSKYNGNDEHDVLADRPNMVILWAGYAFSQDYTKPRGHMHAIEDMRRTLRTGAPMDGKGEMQPGTCWTCKSPDVPRYMAEHGIAEFYAKKWSELGNEIVNPIGCADCHDAKTMNLRVSRPALIGLLTALRTRYLWLLSFSNLIASVFLFILILSPGMQSGALMPALQSAWFPPHVACYITSYSILGVATLLSLKQIRDNRKDGSWRLMPVLDAVVRLGFAFLVLGLITGAVWAKQAWGDYWAWDPKETWAFITVSAYLVYIHLRARRVLTRGTLGLLTVAFLLLLITWLGMSFIPAAQTSVHVYS